MKRNRVYRLGAYAALLGILLGNIGLTGCTAYHLGSNLPPGITSVCVPVFVNQTAEPGLEFETTNAAIEEFQLDGTLRVAPRDQANSLLEVKLTRYALTPLRFRKDQTTTAREYRLTITAKVTLRKLPSNETVVKETTVIGFASFDAPADLPSARRNALPATARNLAHQIVKTVVEYW
jgi:hypothetical protein